MVELIPIDSISVPENRLRKDFRHLNDLKSSIRKHGLLHPLVLDENNSLIAGERRLRALRELGWKEVPVRRFKNLSPVEKLEIELEENLQREDLSWQEQVLAKKRLYELRGGSLSDFSEDLGESIGKTSEDLALARELENNPDSPLWNVEKKTKAKLLRAKSRQEKIYSALQEIQKREETPPETPADDTLTTLLHGDARELVHSLPDGIACVVTDPPWGVSLSSADWDDSKSETADLLREVFSVLHEKLLPDSHCYIAFGISEYCWVRELFESLNFSVVPIPLIEVHKGRCGSGRLWVWDSCYSPWLMLRKGSRILKPPVQNVLYDESSSLPDWHPSPKDPAVLSRFIQASTEPGELVLDPFFGSGSTALACLQTSRRFIGIEKSPIYYAKTKEVIEEWKKRKKSE